MDSSNRTERMNRALTGATSRRQALKLMGGGLAGTFLAVKGLSPATAQDANVGQLVSGLINVNIGAIQVDIDTGDITLVNVENVLNNNEIRILNNVLNRNEVLSRNQNILNNLLRDADIITGNQVVVGILSGGQIVLQDV